MTSFLFEESEGATCDRSLIFPPKFWWDVNYHQLSSTSAKVERAIIQACKPLWWSFSVVASHLSAGFFDVPRFI
jgi:hypothetical protein